MAFTINRPASPGEEGFARLDGVVGETVELVDGISTVGGVTYFELWWVPEDSITALASLAPDLGSDPTGRTWTFVPDADGAYRIHYRHTDPSGVVTEATKIYGTMGVNTPPAGGEVADPTTTMARATEPAVVAACERNVKTARWPGGNPWGWASYAQGVANGGARVRWKGGVQGDLFSCMTVPSTLVAVDAVIANPALALTGLYTITYTGGGGVAPGPDGSVVLTAGMRVLRACDIDKQLNGIYVAAVGAWTRASDANTFAEIRDAVVNWPLGGLAPFSDVALRWTLWNPTDEAIVVGTDPQDWRVCLLQGYPTLTDPAGAIVDVKVATSLIDPNEPLSGLSTIQGYTLSDGDYVLLGGQTDPSENGVYVARAGAWERMTTADTGANIMAATVGIISNGTYVNAYFCLNSDTRQPIDVGVDPQIWFLIWADTNLSGPQRVVAAIDDIVMLRAPLHSGNSVPVVQLPAITPESAGRRVRIRNFGSVLNQVSSASFTYLQPDPANGVDYNAIGAGVLINAGAIGFDVESDGNDRWTVVGDLSFEKPSDLTPGGPECPIPMSRNAAILGDS